MGVEMVEKLMEEVGFLVEKVKEEDGGDGVVVVVRMEEDMEEELVEELVEKWVEMEGKKGGRPRERHGCLCC